MVRRRASGEKQDWVGSFLDHECDITVERTRKQAAAAVGDDDGDDDEDVFRTLRTLCSKQAAAKRS